MEEQLIEKIKKEASLLTSNKMMQEILVKFANSQVIEAQKILIKNSQKLICFEYQIMSILELFIFQETGINPVNVKTRHSEEIEPKHIFCYLSDYYLNSKEIKSRFAQKAFENKMITGTNSSKIAKYVGLKQHATVISAINQINNRIDTEKTFKEKLLLIRLKSETLLNSTYNL